MSYEAKQRKIEALRILVATAIAFAVEGNHFEAAREPDHQKWNDFCGDSLPLMDQRMQAGEKIWTTLSEAIEMLEELEC